MPRRRLTIYGNWSAYDELSDGVPLTEELAMRQMDELLRLRSHGVHFDAYLMDAFWFDPDGGYRSWRTPNWPDGPGRWLQACQESHLIPGLWFTANTLCHINPAPAWLDSADENKWGLCCFHGGFLADYLDQLAYWYDQGIRIFKLDFADFTAAPPEIKARLTPQEIRIRNIDAFRSGLTDFRQKHPDAILMGFNGFEEKGYMDRTDRPLEGVLDLRWLDVFDSIYSGDPRPADVPAIPIWRSVDIYGDYTTRVLQHSGVPLEKIDNCGFMAGPTGTCYWRGKALWKGMLLLTLMRGGDLTVLYGDLSLFDSDDAEWMAQAQLLIEAAFSQGPAESFGGVPGETDPYGWIVGGRLLALVNPSPITTITIIPAGDWRVLFQDDGFPAILNLSNDTIRLGSYQLIILGLDGPDLGRQADSVSQSLDPVWFTTIEQSERKLVVEAEPGELQVVVRQRDAIGHLVRTFAGQDHASKAISIRATQEGSQLESTNDHDRAIWSGMSWGAIEVHPNGSSPIRIEVEASDPSVASLELQLWQPAT